MAFDDIGEITNLVRAGAAIVQIACCCTAAESCRGGAGPRKSVRTKHPQNLQSAMAADIDECAK